MQRDVTNFYRGKKVVVIGGAGFVGIQLVRQLVDTGADVWVIDDFSRGQNIVTGAKYVKHDQFSYLGYELVDSASIGSYYGFENVGFDITAPRAMHVLQWALSDAFAVFNLAAVVAGVLHNENHHVQMYDDNIRVLASPLRASEQAGVPHYLSTSSVCVYSEDHQSPCDEAIGWGGDPHPANAGYAEAKRDGERLVQWSSLEHAVIVRPSNIIGPYDYYDDRAHVVPAFIKRAVDTKGEFKLYGNPYAKREFIYSSDVASGMMYALALGKNKEAYNLGTGGDNQITMIGLADWIIKNVESIRGNQDGGRILDSDTTKGGGDVIRYSNCDKIYELGWKHQIDLYSALLMTIHHYMG